MVVGNVEPSGLAIDQKKFLFRRVIFSAHLSRTPEVHGAGLDLRLSLAFAVAFQENGLQGARLAVMLFQKMRESFRRSRGLRRDRGSASKQTSAETAIHSGGNSS